MNNGAVETYSGNDEPDGDGDGEMAAIKPNVSTCLPNITPEISPVTRVENAPSVSSGRYVEPLDYAGCHTSILIGFV